MIDLFNHPISGTSYFLLYVAAIGSVAAWYWLSTKLNEHRRKVASPAARRPPGSRQQRRPLLRARITGNTVIQGSSKQVPARRRVSSAVELQKRMSSLYVFNPATCSVSRRTFASAQDTREAWVEKYQLSNGSDRSDVLPFTPRLKSREDTGATENAQAG